MTIYSRPNKYTYSYYPPPGGHIPAYYDKIGPRYVSKPMGKEICPYRRFSGYSRITATGTAGSSNYVKAQSAENGIIQERVNPDLGRYAQTFRFPYLNLSTIAKNMAYDKFRTKVLGDTAELGVNLAERRQAVRMIYDRAATLYVSYKLLRQGKFRLALKRLNVKILKKHERWTHVRNASAFWLEYHFGWSPLIGDIYSACEILQSGYGKPRSVKARGTASDYEGFYSNYGSSTDLKDAKLAFSCQTGAEVTITNPNLHLATRLGLTNPASVAWELIPFSFLVDWFFTVGTFLNSYSDFIGVSFKNAYTTTYGQASGSVLIDWRVGSGQYGLTCYSSGFSVSRAQGLVSPIVYPKFKKGLSVTRAATAVSLLLQVFQPGKP